MRRLERRVRGIVTRAENYTPLVKNQAGTKIFAKINAGRTFIIIDL